jgi:hypothetical protein
MSVAEAREYHVVLAGTTGNRPQNRKCRKLRRGFKKFRLNGHRTAKKKKKWGKNIKILGATLEEACLKKGKFFS